MYIYCKWYNLKHIIIARISLDAITTALLLLLHVITKTNMKLP